MVSQPDRLEAGTAFCFSFDGEDAGYAKSDVVNEETLSVFGRSSSVSTTDLWRYRNAALTTRDLTGYKVEAVDGDIGKIDEATNDVSGSYVVVDTGPWIFGKKVLIPAGLLGDVDDDAETVYVNRTKDEIKNAPEFDEDRYRDEGYRSELGGYYDQGGAGYRDDLP